MEDKMKKLLKKDLIRLAFIFFGLYLLVVALNKYGPWLILYMVTRPHTERIKIRSDKYDDVIYMKKFTWGFPDSKTKYVISTNSTTKFDTDENKEYVLMGYPELYYKMNNDTLIVYSFHLNKIPPEFDSRIRVRLIDIDNLQYLELRENYREKDLKRF